MKKRMKKILLIFGTRPEAIKMAPVIKELEKHPAKFLSIVCVTAQHREMLDQVLRIFDIRPDYDLDIMGKDQSLHDVTSKSLLGIKKVIEKEMPDLVLVQGDTTTTFAAGLAAFYAKTPLAHVEAGLRTHDKHRPFPEEINRRLTTQMADIHLAPTERSRRNLLQEGIDRKRIFVTGNTVIDALAMIAKKQASPDEKKRWNSFFVKEQEISFDDKKKTILVTGHRRENFGEGLENICKAIKRVAADHEDVEFVYPVHLNPNVRKPVHKHLGNLRNVKLIPPLDYEPFVYLMTRSAIILTDSGGIQEEAPSLGKPVLVMRETTERPEAVEAGSVRLVGTDTDKIVREVERLLKNKAHYAKMASVLNPYGDGNAAGRIVKIIDKFQNDH
jgi:UDP-N-acetylglucosamine 2-epimerase (non-hydrolysing)